MPSKNSANKKYLFTSTVLFKRIVPDSIVKSSSLISIFLQCGGQETEICGTKGSTPGALHTRSPLKSRSYIIQQNKVTQALAFTMDV